MPCDNNDIYNDLICRLPKNFNDLLPRIDEFSRVEDDDKAANRSGFKREKNGSENRREDGNTKNNCDEGSSEPRKGETFQKVNTVFTKPIHKIMWEIKEEQFFKWPKSMVGDPSMRDTT